MKLLLLYATAFLLGTVKFMFSASIMFSASDLSFFEVALFTCLGALFSFNVCFFSASFLMKFSHNKRLKSKNYSKPKKIFTKKNKTIVKFKMSTKAMLLIATLAPLFMSVPLGAIVVAKFYRRSKWAYFISSITLLFAGIGLAATSYYIKCFIV